jgi:hypothetical protein
MMCLDPADIMVTTNPRNNHGVRSGLVIFVLIILSVLVAQSRRNCEVPGSTWIPCIWGSPLNHHNKHRFSE